MTQADFIVCDNLVKIYKVANLEVVALQGLDLTISEGELVGVVGASGSGKSTLMNILGGLDRPSAGRAWVNGQDLLKLSDAGLDHYRHSSVGFVWQQGSRNLIPYLTAQQNIEFPMKMTGTSGRKARSRARDLLEAVGLGDRRKHRLSELSGGEQQRIAIAVALANQPRLLLADEPTGEVDSSTAAVIFNIFRKLNREMGLTILIVSHDQGIAYQVDRVVAIRDGKLASETVRQNNAPHPGTVDGASLQDQVFEELTVLDSSGRLQVPKEFRERYGIKRRVRLEPVEDGIIIRAVENAPGRLMEGESNPDEAAERAQRGLRGVVQRLRNRVSRPGMGG